MLNTGHAFRQSTSTRTRAGTQRFDSEVALDTRVVVCGSCTDEVPAHDSVLTGDGVACLRCDRELGIAEALDTESRELELGLVGTVFALLLMSGAALGTTWTVFQGVWIWSFVAWMAAQFLAVWIGLYGARQGWDAIRTLNRLTDDDASAMDSARRARIRLLGQLAFWGGGVVTGGSMICLVLVFGGMLTLATLS